MTLNLNFLKFIIVFFCLSSSGAICWQKTLYKKNHSQNKNTLKIEKANFLISAMHICKETEKHSNNER